MKKLFTLVLSLLIGSTALLAQEVFYQPGIKAFKSGQQCNAQNICDDADANSIDYCGTDGCVNAYSLGLPVDRTFGLWRGASGKLLINRFGGLSLFDGTGYTNLSARTTMQATTTTANPLDRLLGIDELDRIYSLSFTTGGGDLLRRWDGTQWEDLLLFPDQSNENGFASLNNEIWMVRGNNQYWHYDGQNWQNTDLTQSYSFTANSTRLVLDASGDVWIASEISGIKGLLKYDGSQWQWLPFMATPINSFINDLVTTADEKLYILSTGYGLLTYDNGSWSLATNQSLGVPVADAFQFVQGNNGQIWAAAGAGGLVHFDGTNWLQYNHTNSAVPELSLFYVAAHPNHPGVYFSDLTYGEGYFYFDGTNLNHAVPDNSGPPQGNVHMGEAPNQDLWVYSAINIFNPTRFDGTNWLTLSDITGKIHQMDFTPSGTTWIASWGDYDINTNHHSIVWQWDGTTLNKFDHTNSLLPSAGTVTTLEAITDSDVWVGSYGDGLFHYDGTNWATYTTSLGNAPSDFIHDLHQTNTGSLYALAGNNDLGQGVDTLLQYVNGTWTIATLLPNPGWYYELASESDGSLWINGFHAILQYDGSTIQSFPANGPPFNASFLQTMTVDAQDQVWVGTPGNAIYKWNGTNWSTISLGDFGIVADSAIQIHAFSDGSLWVSADEVLSNIVVVDTVWPGDADNDGIAHNVDLLAVGQAFGSTGPARNNASLTWIGQAATPWATSLPNGTDYVHTDTDGSGTVDLDDTLAINLNYGLIHNKTSSFSQFGAPPLLILPDLNSYMAGDTVEATIELGLDTLQADSAYGIAFSIFYDASLVEPNSIEVYYDNSWLGVKNQDMITLDIDMPDDGRIDLALSRTDQTEKSGYGEIARIRVVMIDDISGKNLIRDTLVLRIEEVYFIKLDGTEIPYSTEPVQVEVTQEVTPIENPLAEQWQVYPNPARNVLYIESSRSPKETTRLHILTMEGKSVYQTEINLNKETIMLSGLPNGLYLLVIRNERSSYQQKLMIIQ